MTRAECVAKLAHFVGRQRKRELRAGDGGCLPFWLVS